MQLINEEKEWVQNVVEEYYFRSNETQKYWKRDNNAALKIQSKFKMYIKRKQFKRMKEAAIKIQTFFRAYHAKKQFKVRRLKHFNQINLKYFSDQATIIQKMFRGFYVRRYKVNFYLRKEQLSALQQKNLQFLTQLNQFGKAQSLEAQQYKQVNARAQFQALAKNLHHLSSTKAIPGVYNSPFALEKPAVFEKTVESHLKDAFKQEYQIKNTLNRTNQSQKKKN